jgi:hypothetical protein
MLAANQKYSEQLMSKAGKLYEMHRGDDEITLKNRQLAQEAVRDIINGNNQAAQIKLGYGEFALKVRQDPANMLQYARELAKTDPQMGQALVMLSGLDKTAIAAVSPSLASWRLTQEGMNATSDQIAKFIAEQVTGMQAAQGVAARQFLNTPGASGGPPQARF